MGAQFGRVVSRDECAEQVDGAMVSRQVPPGRLVVLLSVCDVAGEPSVRRAVEAKVEQCGSKSVHLHLK